MTSQFVNPLPIFDPPIHFMNYKHLFIRYSIKRIDGMILWCKKEYWDSIRYWSQRGNFKNVQFEVEEFSTIRLMATLSIFDEIIAFIRKFPFIWDGLSKPSRDFLTRAYEFKGLLLRH